MANKFSNLWSADFEDLTRDLIGRELSIRFEAFAVGPDGGMDGRHAASDGRVILQAKHYAGSTFAKLKSAMKRERQSIDVLQPARYLLATSRPLTPSNKAVLAREIGPALQEEDDIYSAGDIEGLLRKYPEIEKSHIKLWLSSTAVLERVLYAAAHQFNKTTRDEIENKLRLYVRNASFENARDKLEAQNVLIISGSPGVGKSTLAEMLCYAYVVEEWELVAIRSLEDGFAKIDDTKLQVFYFDDFLGRVALDRNALAHKDSDLARFINRIKRSQNARFVLTTRAYLFEEARMVSEHLGDSRLNINKFVLDVGDYTRRIKARILYNHLLAAGTPQGHINALVMSDVVASIVDHRNYSPRIIEWMTDRSHVSTVAEKDYPAAFIEALDNPADLWKVAFQTHISPSCQHLLQALFFESEYGVHIDDLRISYDSLHSLLCKKYGTPYGPKDFEDALQILEGGFIHISDKSVEFINPSLRDYLTKYLNDLEMLKDAALSARRAAWARAVWRQGVGLNLQSSSLLEFSSCFSSVSELLPELPVWKFVRDDSGLFSHWSDLDHLERIELLISWWQASGNERFIDVAISVAEKSMGKLSMWRGGRQALSLVGQLRGQLLEKNPPKSEVLASRLEDAIVAMVEGGVSSEDLEALADMLETWGAFLGQEVEEAFRRAVDDEIVNVRSIVADIDSESTLDDHIESLKRLASKSSLPAEDVMRAIGYAQDRLLEIEESAADSGTAPAKVQTFDADQFNDAALRNLFMPLVQSK